MSEALNQVVLEFFDSLPSHTKKNLAVLSGLKLKLDGFARPGTDYVSKVRLEIFPDEADISCENNLVPTLLWSALFDHYFARNYRWLTSREMHKVIDEVEASVGESAMMREDADKMDGHRRDFEAGKKTWLSLRQSVLSPASISDWEEREMRL